jgi:hypothetical protein
VQSWVESHESAQSAAPLQFSVQSRVHPVIVHEVEPWHVRVQSFPVQSMAQVPPVQVCVQSPPAHWSEHAVELVQVWLQSPPAQVSEQFEPEAQVYWQSPVPVQVSEQGRFGGQLHEPPSHTKPERCGPSVAPPSAGVPALLLQPPRSTAASTTDHFVLIPAILRPDAADCTHASDSLPSPLS